jgi:hypothetical protein
MPSAPSAARPGLKHGRLLRALAVAVAFVVYLTAGGGFVHPVTADDGAVLPLPAEDHKVISAMLGAGVVGQALPSAPIGDPTIYFPLSERAGSYLVTSGPNAGNTQTLNVAKRQRPGGQLAWRAALSPSQAGFIRQTSAGDLMMPAVTDSDHDVLVITTPANPFLLKGMKPGETRKFSQTVSVNYLDDPTRQDYSGSMTGSYTYVGTYQVTVPAGTYQALLMRLSYEGKVGPAHTQDTAYYFFAPQVGTVAMISQEDVEAFWIIHIDTRMGKVLASS